QYNGIGLSTVRGSGTNGYVQTNKASLPKWREKDARYFEKQQASFGQEIPSEFGGDRQPNADILLHERKRQVEVKCVQLQDQLEEEGLPAEEVEEKVSQLRRDLLAHIEKGGGSDGPGGGTHRIAQQMQQRNERILQGLGIDKATHVEGQAFDWEVR
ncbi:cwf21-domain-containing protein, partial [Gonapodya prolifera JEL478]